MEGGFGKDDGSQLKLREIRAGLDSEENTDLACCWL